MELIGHKTEPAAVPAMVGADLFQTQDVEEARQWGVRTFCENRLKKLDGLRPINARMNLRKVRGVGFGRMTYGGAVDIDPGCLESFYLVQVPLSGRELIDTGGQTVCSSGKVGLGDQCHGRIPDPPRGQYREADRPRRAGGTGAQLHSAPRPCPAPAHRLPARHDAGRHRRQPLDQPAALDLRIPGPGRAVLRLADDVGPGGADRHCHPAHLPAAQLHRGAERRRALAAFRCTTSHWPGTRPRRATFFLVVRQERRQRNVPRCRAPFGGSLLPGAVRRGLRKLALRAQTCEALFPPAEPSSRRARGERKCR
jgi:hypothetical protein